MNKDEVCAVCAAAAPKDYWSAGWICVTAEGLVLSREDVSKVPMQIVVAPLCGSCLVCSKGCLQTLVGHESRHASRGLAASG